MSAQRVYVHFVEQAPLKQTCNENLLTQPHVSAPESVAKHTLFTQTLRSVKPVQVEMLGSLHCSGEHTFMHRICVCLRVLGDGTKLEMRK